MIKLRNSSRPVAGSGIAVERTLTRIADSARNAAVLEGLQTHERFGLQLLVLPWLGTGKVLSFVAVKLFGHRESGTALLRWSEDFSHLCPTLCGDTVDWSKW